MSRADTERYLRKMGYDQYVDDMSEYEQAIRTIDDQRMKVYREQLKWAQKRIKDLEQQVLTLGGTP